MSIEELYQYLNDPETVQEEYIVRLSIRYDYEKEPEIINELIFPSPFSPTRWCWENDWNEGQEHVSVLAFRPLQEIEVKGYGTKNNRAGRR